LGRSSPGTALLAFIFPTDAI
jgi:hypothetical protein